MWALGLWRRESEQRRNRSGWTESTRRGLSRPHGRWKVSCGERGAPAPTGCPFPGRARVSAQPSVLPSQGLVPNGGAGGRQVGRLAGRSWFRLRAGGGTQPQTPALPSGGRAAGGTLQAIHASPAAPAALLETCTPRWSAHPMRLMLPHPPAVVLPASSPDPHHWPALPVKGSQGGSTWGGGLALGEPQSRERWSAPGRCREGGGRPERDGGGVPARLAALFQKYKLP